MGKFQIRHVIHVPADRFYEEVFLNEDFNRRMYNEELGFGYELLEWNEATGRRRSRIEPKVEVPAVIRKVLGDSVSFVEEGTYEKSTHRYDFRVVPNTLAEKIKITGDMVLQAQGEHCLRLVNFDIQAKIFGVGKVLESFIQKSTCDRYDQTAEFTNRYLDSK